MNPVVIRIISVFIGYLFGCILTAEIVTRAKGINVREIDKSMPGKGNPGMANVMINVGFLPGVIVFIGDLLKSVIAIFIVYKLFGKEMIVFAGFGAILGHNFPFWRKFDGGKGVMSTGVMLITAMPIYSWIAIVITCVIVCFTGLLNFGAVLFVFIAIPFAFATTNLETSVLICLAALLMLYRNRRDLKKILDGTYSKTYPIKFKKKKTE